MEEFGQQDLRLCMALAVNLVMSVIDREEGCGKEIAQGLCGGKNQSLVQETLIHNKKGVSCMYMQVKWV